MNAEIFHLTRNKLKPSNSRDTTTTLKCVSESEEEEEKKKHQSSVF